MKRERAYVDGRRNQILEILKANPEVRVDQLAERLGVSLITIRRDLQYLEELKHLKRFYGGAKSIEPKVAVVDEVQKYRQLIARYAASMVEDGDSLFINTSSNALQMLQYITCKNVTAITNNGKALRYEYGDDVSVILTGGELRHPKEAMVGDFAIRNLQTVFAKKCFVGCSGLSPLTGMTTEIANEVNINGLMIEHATQDVYILADHTKIGKNSSFTSCTIDKVQHLITDEKASEEILEQMRAEGVQIHQVHMNDY